MLKKLPYPISGLMLGLAGAGNLIQSYSENIRLIFGAVATIIFVMVTLKTITGFDNFKNEMNNPVIASVMPTYSMTGMLLAGYYKPYIGNIANAIWYLSVFIQICFMIYFTFKFVFKFKLIEVFPSWFIAYIGIVIATVSGKNFNPAIGKIAFYFGLVAYIILLPVVFKRVTSMELPEPTKPLLTIFAAPGSLLTAGYMSLFEEKNIYLASALVIISQLIYLIILVKLVELLKLKFYPSYAGFTFPLVISAISIKLSNAYFMSIGKGVVAIKYLVLVETIIAICIVLYVLIRYIQFLIMRRKSHTI
ncbi:TDT family transporter [Miniphocaeibacter massiliensis]|uniref:TDT family transporter n=1 Tax=Miniphocaeibacter massiliensis TaxID=2041841 RepID=UPI000C1C2F90|nr:TDT family transporter [Miniphocaeibacter massiliensis]